MTCGDEKAVLKDPTWVLDRRNSGNLFWRRDSLSERNRVKFRCDVEVLEFPRSEIEREETDWSSEDEDDSKHRWRRRRPWEEDIPPASNFWGSVCILVIAMVLTYQWFSI